MLYNQPEPSVGVDVVAVYNLGTPDDAIEGTQVTAFDRSDGSKRWSQKLNYLQGELQLPTVTGGTVYVVEGITINIGTELRPLPSFSIRALDATDGSEQWAHTYKEEGVMEDSSGAMAGGTTSVAVDDDTVYYGLLYPTPRQTIGRDPAPGALERFEKKAYTGDSLVALNRSDGSVQWTADLGTYAQVFSYLVVDGNHVYVKRFDHDDPDAPDGMEWVVVDKNSGDVAGRFGPADPSSRRRAFGVADGVRVWK